MGIIKKKNKNNYRWKFLELLSIIQYKSLKPIPELKPNPTQIAKRKFYASQKFLEKKIKTIF